MGPVVPRTLAAGVSRPGLGRACDGREFAVGWLIQPAVDRSACLALFCHWLTSLAHHTQGVQGMKVLITGGAGFVGSHLADRLLDRGDQVLVIDNYATGRRDNLSGR